MSLSTKGACRALIPLGDNPHAAPQTPLMMTPAHRGGGINHPEELSRGTVHHHHTPKGLAHCCPCSREEQEPGWSSWEDSHTRLQSMPRTVLPAAPEVLLSARCSFTSELTTHQPHQAEKQNPKQVQDLQWRVRGRRGDKLQSSRAVSCRGS